MKNHLPISIVYCRFYCSRLRYHVLLATLICLAQLCPPPQSAGCVAVTIIVTLLQIPPLVSIGSENSDIFERLTSWASQL